MVIVVVVVAGVGLVRGPGAASPSSSPGVGSPYAQLFAQIGPNGEVTKEMALEAFSLAIAPLPGVTVPTGDPPADYERMDGTFAINWLMPYLDQITPDQKAAVDAALKPDPTAPVITPGLTASAIGMMFAHRLLSAGQDADLQSYLDAVSSAENTIAGKLGRSLHVGWSVEINAQQLAGAHALAYDAPRKDAFGDLSGCDIHVNPELVKLGSTAQDRSTLAHEIFHCFQFDWFDQHGGLRDLPDWIEEGQAEWVGDAVAGPSPNGTGWWSEYLSTPGRQLFSRTYDAIGFYQHLAEEGIDPWGRFDAMLAANTAVDAFKVTGATADSFLDTWSSGLFRDQSLGPPWYATGPWSTSAHAPAQEVDVGIGDTRQVATDVLFNRDVKLVSSADLVEVRMQGHVRIRTDPDGDELKTADRWLCTEALGCKCPPGQRYSGPEFEVVSATVEIGLTGALSGASGTLTGHAVDEFCKPLPTVIEGTASPGSCQDCGGSNGDPHLRTINRYRYDFQGAGEFTLLRNADSSIEVQARQEPYNSAQPGPFRGVSINTAVAARVNGHVIGAYLTSSGLALHVDGSQVDPNTAPDLGSGAAVRHMSTGYEIDFADGTVLWALSAGQWGINALIRPSDALRGSGTGLLGPITPGGMGVPALPDGTQLPAAPDFETRHSILYGQFADAWRVTDASTLFDYDAGKSTATYTDRNFPSDADDAALTSAFVSPDPSPLAAAQSACAGVTDPDLKSECEFDVFATGDDGFAQQYTATQDLYDLGISPPTAGPPPSPGGVTGAQKVVELQDLDGTTIGPDNTIYVSITDSSGTAQLVAIDPTTSAIQQQVPIRVATGVHFAAGSVWMAGQATDANGQYCTVTHYDPTTLATQGDYQLPCPSSNPAAPGLTSMGDALWFVDTSRADPSTGAGTALTEIDPTTNAPGKSVPLGYASACCKDSQGALFCYCGNSDEWRLTGSDSAFVDLGSYNPIYAAGTGFWAEVQQATDSAGYIAGPGGPSAAVPLNDERIVGGDPTGVYLQSSTSGIELYRQPADGSAAVKLATAPVSGSGIDETDYDYLTGGFPWFATPQGYAHLWLFKETPDSRLALWLQWAPLP